MAYSGGYAGGYGDPDAGPLVGMPAMTVEVAFATDPGATPTWVPVSNVEGFTLRRGRSQESDKFLAGRATIVLTNDDRRFEPTYAAGPYYPNVVPMRRVRIRAVWDGVTYDVFSGYADGWEQLYEPPKVAQCILSATDAFKVLANIELPPSVWAAEVRADSPSHWWRLGEPAGATQALDAIGTAHLSVVGSPTFGVDGLTVRDADTAVQTAVGAALIAPQGSFPSGTGPFTIEAIARWAPGAEQVLFEDNVPGGAGIWLYISAAGTPEAEVASYGFDTTISGLTDGAPHHYALVRTATNALRLYVDGVDVTSGSPGTAAAIVAGAITIGNAETRHLTGGTVDEIAVYPTALSPTRIAAHASARAVAWSGETSGARINRILDAAGWPAGDRQIDTGVSVLQGANLGGSALAALQKVEETEQGRLFVTTDGKVRFISRDNLLKTPYTVSQAIYGDTGTELEYEDLVYRYDDQTIYNEAHISRVDGSVVVVRDTTSQTRYLRRVKVIDGLLHQNDTTSVDLANWIVAHYKDPLLRVTDLSLHPAVNGTTHFPEVLGTELAERVTVKRTPQCLGAAIDQAVNVEGITHQVSATDWATKWNLSPAETQVYWILGVAGSSELDQTTRVGF